MQRLNSRCHAGEPRRRMGKGVTEVRTLAKGASYNEGRDLKNERGL